MSRDHDAPLEYLRILASLKLRFGLATLVTAHGALPVAYPIEEQGHSASQLMRWTLSFPIDALDTQLPSSRDGSSSNILGRAEHPSTAGYANPDNDLVGHTSSNALRIFRAPITLVDFTTKEGARPGWHPSSNAGT